MNAKIQELLNSSKSNDYASQILKFIGSGNSCDLPLVPYPQFEYDLNPIWALLGTNTEWNTEEKRVVEVAVHSAAVFKTVPYADRALSQLLRSLTQTWNESRIEAEEALLELIVRHGADVQSIATIIESDSSGKRTWGLSGQTKISHPIFTSALEKMIFEQTDATLAELLWQTSGGSKIVELISRFRPAVIGIWWSSKKNHQLYKAHSVWCELIRFTEQYDQEFINYLQSQPYGSTQFSLLLKLRDLRGGYEDMLDQVARMPQATASQDGLRWLLARYPEEVIDRLIEAVKAKAFQGSRHSISADVFPKAMDLVIEKWNPKGRELFCTLREGACEALEIQMLSAVLTQLPPSAERASDIIACLEGRSADDSASRWECLRTWLTNQPVPNEENGLYQEAFWRLLGNSSNKLRSIAVEFIVGLNDQSTHTRACSLLQNGKTDQKLGSITLMQELQNSNALEAIQSALSSETSEKVRSALHLALKAAGVTTEAKIETVTNVQDFVKSTSQGAKLPKCNWLEITKLPSLWTTAGETLLEQGIVVLIAKQSKHKTIEASPDILPLLVHTDREKSAPFAAALVEGFLNSEQAAADRWALTLGGLLGDNRIITLLLPRINDWCENSRHKLAEYAAQAISLLPGNEPLMVLDTLSNRYRSKFKNVGKACADAFNSAAAARGITTDELGDLVVPDFGFDAEGIRRFDWEGGGASAELGADFKLSWFDPETDKSWKSLPANAPEEIKVEVKTLTKLMREAVKGQTARLELTLVRQRRWASSRWRELFENHPLLRSFASLLVWGVYDASGTLLRTFRRYPNGLLADAAGALEELAETDTMIGMVHPLEMEETALANWRAHLARFKVKQPFPQIDRPAELMEPLHGNRREIAVTNGKKVSAGTFRSRAEKRGWVRGSVIDAGGISSYYKLYPGAGVEVILPTDNFWIGCDPMETIELASAYFAKAGSVERGSYVYNDPGPDDPRVLRFDQVSAVVFSETLSDLKAIIATKE